LTGCSEQEEDEDEDEEGMGDEEEILPRILCCDLFSLLQRTWPKREDQSSASSSAIW